METRQFGRGIVGFGRYMHLRAELRNVDSKFCVGFGRVVGEDGIAGVVGIVSISISNCTGCGCSNIGGNLSGIGFGYHIGIGGSVGIIAYEITGKADNRCLLCLNLLDVGIVGGSRFDSLIAF